MLEFEFEHGKCEGAASSCVFCFWIDFSWTEQELPQLRAVPACLHAIYILPF